MARKGFKSIILLRLFASLMSAAALTLQVLPRLRDGIYLAPLGCASA